MMHSKSFRMAGAEVDLETASDEQCSFSSDAGTWQASIRSAITRL
jgi:hypothetical protein